MSAPENVVKSVENRQKATPVHYYFQVVSKLMLHPGGFFKEMSRDGGYISPLVFLFSCSMFFSILASIFVVQKRAIFAVIFFLNSFSMPFITAFILYLVSILLCKNVFTYQTLFGITAYANVTLLAAWIPGLAWITGIWKFYLIGLGMVKVGRVGGLRAFMCILTAATVLLSLIYLLQPVLKH